MKQPIVFRSKMSNQSYYIEQVKHFNSVTSRALSISASTTLPLEELEIGILSYHRYFGAPGTRIEEHEHPNYELSVMEIGEMVSSCEGHDIVCTPENKNILFIPPAILHHRVFGDGEVNINVTLVFTISGHTANSRLLCAKLADQIAAGGYCMKLSPQLNNIFQDIKRQAEADKPLTGIAVRYLLQGFITVFFQENFPELFSAPDKAKLLDQFDFEDNRVEVIKRALVSLMNSQQNTLKALQETFKMSPQHLNRIFKRETGMTITEYQTRQKLIHAKNLLTETNISISEIAHALGFRSLVRFSCFFKEKQGCPPSYFRSANKSV